MPENENHISKCITLQRESDLRVALGDQPQMIIDAVIAILYGKNPKGPGSNSAENFLKNATGKNPRVFKGLWKSKHREQA